MVRGGEVSPETEGVGEARGAAWGGPGAGQCVGPGGGAQRPRTVCESPPRGGSWALTPTAPGKPQADRRGRGRTRLCHLTPATWASLNDTK